MCNTRDRKAQRRKARDQTDGKETIYIPCHAGTLCMAEWHHTIEEILKAVNGTLNNIRRFRSREFYDMFKSQIIASNETMHISNFLASYCAADKEMQGFVAKVVQEKEKKTQRV